MADDEPDALRRASMAELLAAAAGVGLQLASTGPIGAVAGAMLPPAMLVAFRVDERARARKVARAARALELAADELGTDLPDLERRALADDRSTALVSRVLAAAADSAGLQRKIEALGRVLADGLEEDARLDEALVLAAALGDMEAPHVRMLANLGTAWMGQEGPHWRYSSHAVETRPMSVFAEQVVPALLAVLIRHGLVIQKTVDRRGVNGVERGEEYAITELGTTCLQLLQVPIPDHKMAGWEGYGR